MEPSTLAVTLLSIAAITCLFGRHALPGKAKQFLAAALATLGLAGCVVYEPVPVDPMQQPWQSAIGAIDDAGLTLVTADRGTGTVRGTRGNVEGIILVRMRNDGRVGVEISSRDPDQRDPGLTKRLTDAYNRRMGR